MKRIGILSDTHGWLDPKLLDYFAECDEVWHLGDVGNIGIVDTLAANFFVRGVRGNIDGKEVRLAYPEYHFFSCEGCSVLLLHIGGYPKRYAPAARSLIAAKRPKLFICGHSHIAKVMYDNHYQMLTINPGAAGKYGIQKVRTAIRLTIDSSTPKELEVIELSP